MKLRSFAASKATVLSSALVLALGATFFTSAASAQTVRASMQSPLRVMDPIVNTATITRAHAFMIYDTLLATDANFEIQPQMAEKWEVSDDGKRYVFTLRDGLKWHDGGTVTAEDCVASFKRWSAADATGQLLSAMIDSVNVVDDKSFEVLLKEPTTLILDAFSSMGVRVNFIMPKRIAETPPSESIKEHIGSGPFRMVMDEFKPGLKAVYEKFADYVPRKEEPSWAAGGKVVNVDRVEWIAMPDQMTSINALLNNEIDYVEQVPFDLLPLVEGNDDFVVTALDKLGYWTYYRLNHLHPPFDNKLVRQAAMQAIGQESVLQAMIGDPKYYQTCEAVFGCGTPYADSYGKDIIIPANPEKSKELLKEAGYDGTPIVVMHPTDNPLAQAQPVVISDALRAGGFKVDMQTMDWQTLISRRTNQRPPSDGGWHVFVSYSAVANTLDPLRSHVVAADGVKSWFGWPNVPETGVLRNAFARAGSEEERKEITKKLQKIMVDEVIIGPLGQYVSNTAYSKKISGVLEASLPLFWNISKSN